MDTQGVTVMGQNQTKCLVVLSGGLDSTTALALAIKRYRSENVWAITFDYGQRHRAEIECAQSIVHYCGIGPNRYMIQKIELGHQGVLMDHAAEMPHLSYEELAEVHGPSPTYVPYRNGTFLSLAASYALDKRVGASIIYAGMHAEDAANWAYPDCTPEFIGAMQNAIYVGTYHKVRLEAPFTYKTKAEVVGLGHTLNVPFQLTHSCYEGKRPACGQCPTCVGRLEAFKECGLVDPLPYQFDRYREIKDGQW